MPEKLDREAMDELLRLAERVADESLPLGFRATARDIIRHMLYDQGMLVSLIELAREGLAARETKAALRGLSFRGFPSALQLWLDAKGPNDDTDQR